MKMGDVVSHTLNENARGLILTEGESAMGQKFFIVGWFENEKKNCVQTTRNKPEDLIAL
tara:strand:+ start:293 stop:469 length:177 start_codon:yes stop_codon:yes gene_type:complete